MSAPSTLRRELLLSFGVVFAAALVVAVLGMLIVLPLRPILSSPRDAARTSASTTSRPASSSARM